MVTAVWWHPGRNSACRAACFCQTWPSSHSANGQVTSFTPGAGEFLLRSRSFSLASDYGFALASLTRRCSKGSSKQRQTAHERPIEARIMYPFHPRCGETVLVQRRFAYRGVDLVVIPQPDGSVACIPAWMTHERAARFMLSAELQFSLGNLRSLRAETDALLGFLQSDSRLERDGNGTTIRKPATESVQREQASRCAGSRREGRACDAGAAAAARGRDGACKRGERR